MIATGFDKVFWTILGMMVAYRLVLMLWSPDAP